ncbi:hypothetical protein KA344_20245, partial [bacterium]|nr:hypothetical protein [bacterium]
AANILHEMMTIKADDIQGRHQSYADMVQSNPITPGGRTAAFDGLCCEIRGLGMEVTLGKVVDSFEPIEDRSCVQPNGHPTKTLEEKYQVSAVHQMEDNEGHKVLEIPAGDFVPASRPPALPLITSLTSGKHGGKPRIEMSQEPLFDDIEEGAPDSDKGSVPDSIMDAFIAQVLNEVEEVSPLDLPKVVSVEPPKEVQKSNGAAANYLSEVLARELGTQSTLNGFPSLSELSTLAQQLVTLNQDALKQHTENPATNVQNESEKLTELAGYFKKSTKNSETEAISDNSPITNPEDSS